MIILYLIFCIIVHEFGHLIASVMLKCKVEVFSLGFGKPICSFKYKKIIFNICPILLGGYCKLKGDICDVFKRNSFARLPYSKKFLILSSGCIVNIFFGYLFLIAGIKISSDILYNLGFINMLLGISNLLPIPALDGGYLALVWLEKIYKKAIAYKIISIVSKISFIILMTLNIVLIIIYLLIKFLK